MAETSDEIEEVCRYYDSYGLSSLFVSSKLRKIEMRDYLGQLSIKFSPAPAAGAVTSDHLPLSEPEAL